MKISKHIRISLTVLIATMSLASCHHSHDHSEGGHSHGDDAHDHGESDGHANEGDGNHQKTVLLNEAQYKNAEIDTGWFFMKNLSEVVHANGYTKLDPEHMADVNMPISGTIKSVKVIEGDYVRKGATLATMESLDYNNMLFERSKIQEELNAETANEVYIQQEYDRQKTLAEENINAQKVFQKVSADLNRVKSKIEATRNQLQIMDQMIGMISNNGSTINVSAPISGYITNLTINVGSVTTPGNPMFSIVDNSQMHVDLLVYEKDLGLVKKGQTVRFILTNQSNQEIEGQIYNIGKSFASDTKSVAVHADIEDNDANLIPGMYINALIDIGSERVQSLPEGAIVAAEGREFVFLWDASNSETEHHEEEEEENHAHDDGHSHGEHADENEKHDEITFRRLEIKTGARQLGFVEVTPLGVINKGDKIVTDGAYYIQSHLQKGEGGGSHSH